MINVKETGAVADDKTLCTSAIQKAVDSGDVIYIPQGTYKYSTIHLKSSLTLYLNWVQNFSEAKI